MSQQAVPAYSPQRPPSDTRGLAAGIASIVCAVLAPVVGFLAAPVGMAGVFSQASMNEDSATGPWIVGAVAMVVGALLLCLAAIVCGLVAVVRAKGMNAGRITGFVGLGIMAMNLLSVVGIVLGTVVSVRAS
ncbi:hypothetical protein BIU82_17485 [Arthrobacter sp. SW1]|uniref:hypothetical protein n=1 Tax=Arthrobacter sp. SW1 TaxID=1920889 RepID=UPI000877D24C|nr:hypothetical protein [Arthrobacter sp. SW1]OFI38743.1 hypothetical protein BIU82_17485 [Arthrobacter sp. SW1]